MTNKEGAYATIVLPSGETRRVPIDCKATVGVVGNTDHQNVKLGKRLRDIMLRYPAAFSCLTRQRTNRLPLSLCKTLGSTPACSKWTRVLKHS